MSKDIKPMKLLKLIIILTLTISVLQSCGPSAKIYKVKEYPIDYNPKKVINDFYNEDAKLGYTVLRDDSHLYINLSTTETASQLKLLENGVTIFIDKSGKENKESYLQYPIKTDTKTKIDFKSLKEDKSAFINNKIADLEENILLVNGDSQKFIHRELNDEAISTDITFEEEELYYQLKFPISYLATDSKKLPSIGIFIEDIEKAGGAQPTRTASSAGRGSGTRGSGGARGSGGRRGGGGRMGGGSTDGSAQSQPRSQFEGLNSAIEIWFQVDLK